MPGLRTFDRVMIVQRVFERVKDYNVGLDYKRLNRDLGSQHLTLSGFRETFTLSIRNPKFNSIAYSARVAMFHATHFSISVFAIRIHMHSVAWDPNIWNFQSCE